MRQLILRKIIKTIVIRCQILRLKCTKIDFGWGPPQTPLGEITVLPDLLAGIKGPYFYEKGRRAGTGTGEREVNAGEGKGREGREGSAGDSRVYL